MSATATKQRLLDGAIDYVAHNGLAEVSLRQLATALGTSHRMLIFHFGSKEKLWIEIARAVELRQREYLGQLLAAPGQRPGDRMRTWWRHISDPALWPNERLFFELYGQALQGRPHTSEFLDGVVDGWVDHVLDVSEGLGVPAAQARTQIRLGVAVVRGLLLDLLATGDRSGVDAAMEAFIDLSEVWLQHQTSTTLPDEPPAGP